MPAAKPPAFAKPASAGEGRPATKAPCAPAPDADAGADEPRAATEDKKATAAPAPRFHTGGPDYRPGLERAPPSSLVERFVADLTRDFVDDGWKTIRKLREDHPVQYLKLCADFVAKEETALLIAKSEAAAAKAAPPPAKDPLEGMSDDELLERIRRLAAGLGLGAGAHPGKTGRGA